MALRLTSSLVGVVLVVITARVRADQVAPEAPSENEAADAPNGKDEAASRAAREAFIEGAERARKAQWGGALAAFERASSIKPHAITTYNIGTCQRAIGAYAQALLTFRRALAEHVAPDGGTLPPELVERTEIFVAEIDKLLVTVELTVVPTGARLAIDGRPLKKRGDAYFAGVRDPGAGEPLSAKKLTLRLDPGAHVFAFERAGFETALINETFSPGTKRSLRIELDTLPARLRVDATVAAALVSLDGDEAGPTPLEIVRPAGTYEILVQKEGYQPHQATVDLSPGEELTIMAPLAEETTSVFETWWFWTAAGVLVAGGVTATYFLTQPEPQPAPYDGGTLGWVVTPEAIRF